ncbi:MAG: hypothetical protein ABIG69_16285, partial [Bacteroidota bacterium]
MLKRLKLIKITRSKEKLSNRIGIPLVKELIGVFRIREKIDEVFGRPGNNRGILASDYLMTIVYMFIALRFFMVTKSSILTTFFSPLFLNNKCFYCPNKEEYLLLLKWSIFRRKSGQFSSGKN